ncbi:MAG: alanine racemase [Vicinamibacterales bacterium]|nr:alanine racemase [Vicinamibacterales bacterium]
MSVSRRAFLSAAGATITVPTVAFTRRQALTPPSSGSLDPWIEVNAAHLAHNAAEVARLTGRPILAVIKNNGYGLGVEPVARVLAAQPGVSSLAVIKVDEALRLRDAGVSAPLVLMGPVPPDAYDLLLARDIQPMVYTPVGDALARAAARTGRPARVQLCVDAGLGRVGVPYREAVALGRDLADRGGIELAGTMMTFTEDEAFDREVLTRFLSVVDGLRAAGVDPGRRHAASSYTLFQLGAEAHLDMVRTGMVLFGVYPAQAFRAAGRMDLRPAVALRARVAYVKKIEAGESAGYERAYRATRDTWIATLPVGHGDGWPRAAARGARVRINGRHFPVIASVSASHTLVELGDTPAAAIGDVATMFDWEEGSRPEDVSAACGASVYDLLMHLGALVPRRVV